MINNFIAVQVGTYNKIRFSDLDRNMQALQSVTFKIPSIAFDGEGVVQQWSSTG